MGRYVEAEVDGQPDRFRTRSYRAYVPHTLGVWVPTLNADSVNAITAAESALAATAEAAQTTLGDSLMD